MRRHAVPEARAGRARVVLLRIPVIVNKRTAPAGGRDGGGPGLHTVIVAIFALCGILYWRFRKNGWL